ncbi:urease accessory protein UreF [Actinomadura keratinilytica]|jgi:urease accessory protein|uniref:urease accessory protein UreF n=1 Tax=Actinomadura keratinilytica TaxID=547461 RepID=UPI003608D9F5
MEQVPAALLLLADARLPAGGHAHSGGLEPAAAAHAVTGPDDLRGFLRGRLATAGLTAAALAAAACAHAGARPHRWRELDAEADARMPSPAQRRASRAQGRSLSRAARAAWSHPGLDALAAELAEPHHPVVLGAAAAAAGGTPGQAAAVAAYGAVTGPASAAVRLLGLDPLGVHAVLAGLAAEVDGVAREAAAAVEEGDGDGWRALPAPSAPLLDLLAEAHVRAGLRLFAS